jgi:hypothetical protein
MRSDEIFPVRVVLDLKKLSGCGVFDAGLVAEGRETIKMRLLDLILWLFGVAGVVV